MIKIKVKTELKNNLLRNIFGFNFKMVDIARNILSRFENSQKEDETDALIDAFNDELIYNDDMWEVMKFYQSPEEANYNEAEELFLNDLLTIVYECYIRIVDSDQLKLKFE